MRIALLVLALLCGCQTPSAVSQANAVASTKTPAGNPVLAIVRPDDRHTFGYAEMDVDGRITVRRDGSPGVFYVYDPATPGYRHEIELALGLSPGESKRQYGANGSYQLKSDGTYQIKTLAVTAAGDSAPVTRTVRPGDPEHQCLVQAAQDLGTPIAVGEAHPYFDFLEEWIVACLDARATSDEPSPPA